MDYDFADLSSKPLNAASFGSHSADFKPKLNSITMLNPVLTYLAWKFNLFCPIDLSPCALTS